MLIGMPGYWRLVNYLCAIGFIVIAFSPDAYWQIVLAAGLGAAVILLQLFLAVVYRNPFNSLPNRVYILGWLAISLTTLVHTVMFINGHILETGGNLAFNLLILAGVICVAVAVEAHEKVLIHKQYEQQKNTIADLQRFYDFFRNSAEGLYSSTSDGQLVSVNPAMCQLFGYQNERQLLNEVRNATQFYANDEDRDVLIGELLKNGYCVNREVKGIRRDGTEFWFSISVQMREDDGSKLMFGSIVDITERKQSDISLRYMATHDSLTGIYNRRHFEGQLSEALSGISINDDPFTQEDLTLLYLDLDQFKVVNDSCGHKAGDVLIKQLAQKLNDVVMNRGILGRMGGDEFAVLLKGGEAAGGYTVAKKLLNTVQDYRFIWDNRMFTLGVSIGMVDYREGINSAEQLMSMADSACYLAKQSGRNQIHVYSSKDAQMQRYEADLDSINLINHALDEDKFTLFYQHYQPLHKVSEGHHYEILPRIIAEDQKIIPPIAFLPAAERYNLSAKIDKWVVNHYLRWLSQNPKHLEELVRANINLSGLSLGDKDLKLYFLNTFEKYGVPYEKVCFEITESHAITKMEETLDFINTFRKLGCNFALDDFGIGFSSYEHLKKLPVDYVKIDGSFVKDILVDPIDMAMVCSMKDVAKAMGIWTVAEYVESTEIMVELGKIGVDYAQGYGVAKPAPLSEFKAYN
jgi:diguanylate cyclase (GGDEF)-like protein/PAS domain S-box-containing protein